MIVFIIVALVLTIMFLVVYNIQLQKRIEQYANNRLRDQKLSVINDFLNIAGEGDSVDEKLNKINETVI